MQTDNDAPHVERFEDSQPSSAGWDTQRFPVAPQPYASPPAPIQPLPVSGRPAADRTNLIALALIAVGALIWLSRIVPDEGAVTGGMILLTISSPFLFFAFWKRIYPLLIPGAILAGLSIGVPLAELTNGISVMWGLALGFMAIYFLGRELFNMRTPWAVFPAVPLFGVGVLIAIASLPTFFAAGFMWLPVLLIGAGLYLGWGRRAP